MKGKWFCYDIVPHYKKTSKEMPNKSIKRKQGQNTRQKKKYKKTTLIKQKSFTYLQGSNYSIEVLLIYEIQVSLGKSI